ncbi:MAG TPA: 23S rRNA (uracil(1939)-C(5))-methyltransferase RlmD [Candidatus Acidoferrales bacterium]|nr:23S rRNA (uracil(1939)-C(5))-methyltransferase RlmD [Candidatus Acidoferrales bacterium]
MDITIEKLIYGGEGLAHHEGSTVFVPFVLPAERVAVEAIEQKRKFVRGRVEGILQAAPERVEARCPHFGICGGCDYQHIPYEAQLKFKAEILRETLRRIGKIDWEGEITAHGSPPWAYRNRAQWKVRPLENSVEEPTPETGADGGTKLGIGYFRANSTALCAVEDCSIISPLLLKTLLSLRTALAAGVLPRGLREMEAFVDAADAKLLLTATFAGFPSRAAEHAETFRRIVPEIASLLLHDPSRDRMELYGPGYLEYAAGEMSYRVGHFSFFQVNRFLVEELAREVVAREEGGRLAIDLFAGVGLFSIPLAKRFARVLAVESNPAAARDMETNMRGQGSIEVRSAEVEQFLKRNKERPELLVLDPPRAGMTPESVERLGRLRPERITYVSCEPPTLARDLVLFGKAGYDCTEVHLFDLFPQTFHMETVVRLRKRG